MEPKQPAVYILANKKNGTLYIGVTSDLEHRVWEHKQEKIPGFTKKYSINKLVYYELYENIRNAIQREKDLKHWNRLWKLRLINQYNSNWKDLYEDIAR
ncbi:GIY-YIG nuclease family protein [Candidatus Gracilibacteria bacterium]|nr:GIY-YIG nuclease family protein [Candidatus Gracilibacteria bacterium]MCF7818974.1 GIY-YIG nuclease family protein [Candidatus Gracilibacteria bacterium]